MGRRGGGSVGQRGGSGTEAGHGGSGAPHVCAGRRKGEGGRGNGKGSGARRGRRSTAPLLRLYAAAPPTLTDGRSRLFKPPAPLPPPPSSAARRRRRDECHGAAEAALRRAAVCMGQARRCVPATRPVNAPPVPHSCSAANSLVYRLLEAGNGPALDASKPHSELWMGTHPNGPSRVLLDEGEEVEPPLLEKELGRQLPYLFKVLSIAKPLSIQVRAVAAIFWVRITARSVLAGTSRPAPGATTACHTPRRVQRSEPQARAGVCTDAVPCALRLPAGGGDPRCVAAL